MSRSLGFAAQAMSLCGVIMLLSSCSSLVRSERQQVVWIESEQDQLKVLNPRGESLGETPGYFEIRRARRPKLLFEDPQGAIEKIALPTRYRWADSGLRNLIFYVYAPVGWVTDLVSGAAWQIDGLPATKTTITSKKRIAVAPAQAPNEEISDRVAELVVDQLRLQYPDFEILDYLETKSKFFKAGIDHGYGPRDHKLARIYFDLKIDWIVHSKLQTNELSAELSRPQVWSETIEAGSLSRSDVLPYFELEPESLLEKTFLNKSLWARLLPNSVALQSRTKSFDLVVGDNRSLVARGSRESSKGLEQALSILDSIEVSNTVSKLNRDGLVYRWALVPRVGASRDRFRVVSENESLLAENFRFRLLEVHLGYGLEVGVQWGRNYLFLKVVPRATWASLRWRTDRGIEGQSENLALTLETETGVLAFIDQHWFVRASVSVADSNQSLWDPMVNTLDAPGNLRLEPNLTTSSLQLGYRFF